MMPRIISGCGMYNDVWTFWNKCSIYLGSKKPYESLGLHVIFKDVGLIIQGLGFGMLSCRFSGSRRIIQGL